MHPPLTNDNTETHERKQGRAEVGLFEAQSTVEGDERGRGRERSPEGKVSQLEILKRTGQRVCSYTPHT